MKVSQLGKDYLPWLFNQVKGRDILFHHFAKLDERSKNYNSRKILIRHDVDDKLLHSVKMAELQAKHEVKATYFILDTAPYWKPNDDSMFALLRYIEALGHEIAWHNDVLSRWYEYGRKVDIKELITEPLKIMRDQGLTIHGSASHGNKLCYEYGYVNYEVFTECKRPEESTHKPNVHELPKVSMLDFGLKYEAYHLPRNQYLSESGGIWRELPDEKHFEDKNLITNILIHPQWWDQLF